MEEEGASDQSHGNILPEFVQNLSLNLKKKYEVYHQIDSLQSAQSLDRIFSVVIPEYAKDIVELESKKNQLMHAFQQMINYIESTSDVSNFFSTDEIPEKKIQYRIEPKSLDNLVIAAVDGSFVRKCYTNFEFSLFRAISEVYSFSDLGVDISYYPVENGIKNYRLTRILNNITDQITTSQVSIDRAFMEITLANDFITKPKKHIDMVILDGSILTEPLNLLSDIPQSGELIASYSKLIKEYKKLYKMCDLQKIDLVGVVKDTRSSTFRKLLSRRIPQIIAKLNDTNLMQLDYCKLMEYFSDLDLFHRTLDIGERSCAFSISSSGNSWIPRQLEILNSGSSIDHRSLANYWFFACYMKPVPFDYPIRVEFHLNKDNFDPEFIHTKIQRMCEILYPLCSKFPDFAVPIPQIEAHLRTKLSKNDMHMVIQFLTKQINEELRNYSKNVIFNNQEVQYTDKFDDFLIKNNFLVPKRRERMPL